QAGESDCPLGEVAASRRSGRRPLASKAVSPRTPRSRGRLLIGLDSARDDVRVEWLALEELAVEVDRIGIQPDSEDSPAPHSHPPAPARLRLRYRCYQCSRCRITRASSSRLWLSAHARQVAHSFESAGARLSIQPPTKNRPEAVPPAVRRPLAELYLDIKIL